MARVASRIVGLLAHTISLAFAGLFVLFIFGELFTPHGGPPAQLREWMGIALITVACCAPALDLRHEMGAAMLSLGSLVLFCLVADSKNWPVAAVLAVPGALHVVHALLERPGHTMRTAG